MQKPKRSFVLELSMEADTIEDLQRELWLLGEMLIKRRPIIYDRTGRCRYAGGGDSGSFTLDIKGTETVDHDHYMRQLFEFLAQGGEE